MIEDNYESSNIDGENAILFASIIGNCFIDGEGIMQRGREGERDNIIY